jgi:hypothetical protein
MSFRINQFVLKKLFFRMAMYIFFGGRNNFCELGAHAKFQDPETTPLCENKYDGSRKKRENMKKKKKRD